MHPEATRNHYYQPLIASLLYLAYALASNHFFWFSGILNLSNTEVAVCYQWVSVAERPIQVYLKWKDY